MEVFMNIRTYLKSNKMIGILLVMVLSNTLLIGAFWFFLKNTTYTVTTGEVETTKTTSPSVEQAVKNYITNNHVTDYFSEEDVTNLTSLILSTIDKNYNETGKALSDGQFSEISATIVSCLNSYPTIGESKTFVTDCQNAIASNLSSTIDALLLQYENNENAFNSLVSNYNAYQIKAAAAIQGLQEQITFLASESKSNDESTLTAFETFQKDYLDFVNSYEDFTHLTAISLDALASDTNDSLSSFKIAYNSYVNYMDITINSIDASLNTLHDSLSDLEMNSATNTELLAVSNDLENLSAEHTAFSSVTSASIEDLSNNLTITANNIDSLESNLSILETKIGTLQTQITTLETTTADDVKLSDYLNHIYPVGSVYLSTSSSSPEKFLGGNWEQIKDTFLMAAGDEYAAGTTGGSQTLTLNASNIPSLSISGTTAKTTTVASNSAGTTTATTTLAANGVGSTTSAGAHTHTFTAPQYVDLAVDTQGSNPYGGIIGGWTTWSASSSGNHTHSLNIPALTVNSATVRLNALTVNGAAVTGSYSNATPSSIDITNKYIAVYMWRRVS